MLRGWDWPWGIFFENGGLEGRGDRADVRSQWSDVRGGG